MVFLVFDSLTKGQRNSSFRLTAETGFGWEKNRVKTKEKVTKKRAKYIDIFGHFGIFIVYTFN